MVSTSQSLEYSLLVLLMQYFAYDAGIVVMVSCLGIILGYHDYAFMFSQLVAKII